MEAWKETAGLDEEKIRLWIEEKMPELLEDFFQILRIRSVAEPGTKEPVFGQGCQDVLERMLQIGEKYGFEVHNYDGYVGRITLRGTGKEEIGIWAHLDVVDEAGADWEYPPYEPTLLNGGVIARGAQDNKSCAMVGLYVLRFLKENGIRPKRSISLYCGTCEEQGMHDLDYFTAHYPCPELSLVPDAGFPVCQGERGSFNGELTSERELDGDILELLADCGLYTIPDRAKIIFRKGRIPDPALERLPERVSAVHTEKGVEISFKGESIQAANPFGGINALHGLVCFLLERGLLSPEDAPLFEFVKSINQDYRGTALDISCGDVLSGPIVLAATQARMRERRLEVSFISKYPVSKKETEFEGPAGEAAHRNGFELKTTRLSAPIVYPSRHPALSLLNRIYNETTGDHAEPFIMSGGTYARKLPNAFAYGPGMKEEWPPEGMFPPGHGDYHQPDESVSLNRIRTTLLIYIRSICGLDRLEKLS